MCSIIQVVLLIFQLMLKFGVFLFYICNIYSNDFSAFTLTFCCLNLCGAFSSDAVMLYEEESADTVLDYKGLFTSKNSASIYKPCRARRGPHPDSQNGHSAFLCLKTVYLYFINWGGINNLATSQLAFFSTKTSLSWGPH